jgi:hypothetical protein
MGPPPDLQSEQPPDMNTPPLPEDNTPPPQQEYPPQSEQQSAPPASMDSGEGMQAAPPPEVETAPQTEVEPAPPSQSEPLPPPEAGNAPPASSSASAQERSEEMPSGTVEGATIWHVPQDIPSLDLFYGQGGREGMPEPPFTFVKEDMHGSNPKFDARDANHRRWRVKLGVEARPEVVASRLLWAVGYYVNDDYVLPRARVRGLRMKRHAKQQRGTEVVDARFARRPGGEKKVGGWKWKTNPFFGTREFNGLRVMMAVLNNWDLKDDNNDVYQDSQTHQRIYLVSDVGATFGTSGKSWTSSGSKAKAEKYRSSKFIVRDTGTEVDFATPASAGPLLAESFGFGAGRFMHYEAQKWIGKNIPTPDAHWIGTLLGQLSHQQLVDAFRAGNFSPHEIEVYVPVVESRIEELKRL